MRRFTLFLLAVSGAANAGVVTVDAASFSPGADITNATPGITLQEVTNYGLTTTYAANPVYTVANNPAYLDAGPALIAHNNGNPLISRSDFRNATTEFHNCWANGTCNNNDSTDAFNVLLMSFQYPTNFLEMRVHRTDNDLDWSYVRLYNKQKQLIANCYVTGTSNTKAPYYVPKTLWFTIPCGDVVRLYDCSGTFCNSEVRVTINRSYPDIAYAVFGGEAYNATRGAINKIAFRRFSDCAL